MIYLRAFRIIITVFLPAILVTSCNKTYVGEGLPVTKTRETGKFTKVALNMDAIVRVTDSASNSCTITAQENLQDIIITRIDGNTLIITTKGTVETDIPVEITLSLSQAAAFEINGSGIIQGVNTIKNESLDFEVNGSGELVLDVVAVKVTGAVTGSGVVTLSGSSNELFVEINGSGTVDAKKFTTLKSKAKIAGSGEISLQVEESLEANLSGSGLVNYRGNAIVDKDISGSGRVVKLD